MTDESIKMLADVARKNDDICQVFKAITHAAYTNKKLNNQGAAFVCGLSTGNYQTIYYTEAIQQMLQVISEAEEDKLTKQGESV